MRRAILLAALLAGAALPSAADAASFCVATPGCANQDLQKALDDALAADGPDVVAVGAGTFSRPGGFRYVTADAANAVEIAGAGPETLVRGEGSGGSGLLAGLDLQSPGSLVRGLRVALVPKGTFNVSAGLRVWYGAAEDVEVVADPDATGVGLVMTDATARRVNVSGAKSSQAALVNGATIEDSRLAAPVGLAVHGPGGDSVIRRTRIDGGYQGVWASAAHVVLLDTVITLSGKGEGLRASDGGTNVHGTIEARHVTVVGAGEGVGAKAMGLGAGGAEVTLADSLLAGFSTAADRLGSGAGDASTNVVLRRSVLPAASSGGGVREEEVLRLAAPEFEDPAAGDYTLGAGSPALDFGTPGDTSATDVLGRARVADGDGDGAARPDPGAFERPARPVPEATGPVPPGPFPPGPDATAPQVSGLRVTLGRRPRARFALTEAAQVTVTLARRRDGRFRRVSALTRDRPAGPAVVRIARRLLRRTGRYRVTVVATDAAGNRGAPAATRFRVSPR
jgi:hypothetical protein